MTYRDAKKYKIGDKIRPRLGAHEYAGADELGNLTIADIRHDRNSRTIRFVCNNGGVYEHKKVNEPTLAKGECLSFDDVARDGGFDWR